MQEDLEHIDLIDKYLNGTLNALDKEKVEALLLSDSNFKREVAIYKKIYEGIKQKEETDLKQRLGGYFKEYQEDKKIVATQKPKGKYRQLYRYIGALAACLIIGGALFFIYKEDQIKIDPKPAIVDVDTTSVKNRDSIINLNEEKLVKEEVPKKSTIEQPPINEGIANDEEKIESLEKDSILLPNFNIEDTQLALGGYKTLPSTSIRTYRYSKTLSYTFNKDTLKLYGDPLLGRLDVESLGLIKNKESGYVVNFKNSNYTLEKTIQKTPLIEAKDRSIGSGINGIKGAPKKSYKPSKEEVNIVIVGIQEISTSLSDLVVKFKGGEGVGNTYFFTKNDEQLELIINADLNKENAKVYKIQEAGQDYYYLVQENKTYALDKKAVAPRPLVLVDITRDKLARLFIERESIKRVVVYKEK